MSPERDREGGERHADTQLLTRLLTPEFCAAARFLLEGSRAIDGRTASVVCELSYWDQIRATHSLTVEAKITPTETVGNDSPLWAAAPLGPSAAGLGSLLFDQDVCR